MNEMFISDLNFVFIGSNVLLTGKLYGFCLGIPDDFRDFFNPGIYFLSRDTPGCFRKILMCSTLLPFPLYIQKKKNNFISSYHTSHDNGGWKITRVHVHNIHLQCDASYY